MYLFVVKYVKKLHFLSILSYNSITSFFFFFEWENKSKSKRWTYFNLALEDRNRVDGNIVIWVERRKVEVISR